MPTQGRTQPVREWYSVSIVSVRRALSLLIFVLLLIGGSLAFQQWERYTIQERAHDNIALADNLARQLESRADYNEIRVEHHTAWDRLAQARDEYDAARYQMAFDRANRSLLLFQSILQIGNVSEDERVRFLSVQGNVEFRRGEHGTWKRARGRDSLYPGDWVQTAVGATAEILFADGSLYTLRQSTMVHLGSNVAASSSEGDQPTDIVYGWVELNTAENANRVKTPKSEATVRRQSEALVAYDRDQASGRFASFKGELDVTSDAGQTRRVSSLQQVEQLGDQLSEPTALPDKPRLLKPPNDQEVDFDLAKEVQLTWQAVGGADSYALQVSNTDMFATTIIDDPERQKTSARLGIRGEGSFFWKVAAVGRDGAVGPWSEPRGFRIAALGDATGVDDNVPPTIDIEEVQAFGTLVIVNGQTEPGSNVSINGEVVSLQLDGTFSKTIQMHDAGWGFVEIVATDAWENSSKETRRVFIDAF